MNGITRYACTFLRNTFLSRVLQQQELTAITGSVELQATTNGQDAQPTENHLSRKTGSLSIHPLGVDKTAKKIYITRSKASYRRLLNEAEVMEFLVADGFEIVELEALPLLKQVAMFAAAKVVVAPHGAGLTNLVFASPGTWVLELLSISYRPVCYKVISEFVGLNYRYVIGEAIQRADGLFQEEPAWYDLRVDLEKIKAILAEFSSSPS
ncbi:glycosyltransferase family 61 protein [Limnothrix redekei]|uniref:Glycosyltransferase family 61 protein n=1 Tax=Limnothrix redekei LRLZ20PSL1 TaxID=3112953 RepID=A0ABW7C909_9CYAN